MRQQLWRWGLVLAWCGLIFFLSSQPHLPGPEDRTMDFIFKKLGHVTAYAMLFFLTSRAIGSKKRYGLIQAFLFCLLYAASDEYHQSFVPGRTPMLRDIGIDMIGVIVTQIYLRYSPTYGQVPADESATL